MIDRPRRPMNAAAEPELTRWSTAAFPGHRWDKAEIRHGAFHTVQLSPEGVVARTAEGAGHLQRTSRERKTLACFENVDLGVAVPTVLSPVVSDGHRSGYLISTVPGEHLDTLPWSDFSLAYQLMLGAFAGASRPADLPPTRTWCGADQWRSVVQSRLGPLLGEHLPTALRLVEAVLELPTEATGLVHGDFGNHNILWAGAAPAALIDFDHACWGDPAIDLAPLVGVQGAEKVATITTDDLVQRAMVHRASLPLQVAAAAALAGRELLRDHALGNFRSRVQAGTSHDPGGARPS